MEIFDYNYANEINCSTELHLFPNGELIIYPFENNLFTLDKEVLINKFSCKCIEKENYYQYLFFTYKGLTDFLNEYFKPLLNKNFFLDLDCEDTKKIKIFKVTETNNKLFPFSFEEVYYLNNKIIKFNFLDIENKKTIIKKYNLYPIDEECIKKVIEKVTLFHNMYLADEFVFSESFNGKCDTLEKLFLSLKERTKDLR